MKQHRVLTGIRPTGALHLGHYVGTLQQWPPLQNDDYECFFLIADIQALTTHANEPKVIEDSVREVILDILSLGIDPSKSNVNTVLQSGVPELTELTVYLSMVTPFKWMLSNPTVKEELKALEEKKKQQGKEPVSTGFMYYVVSQAADILFVSPDPVDGPDVILVPVGQDQVPHLEDNNRIARKFNSIYGKTFVMCEAKVGNVGRLVGLDGSSKMSKSKNNAIYLKDDPKTVEKKVMSMFTDPKRKHVTDPGTVEGNPVFIYHDAFNPDTKRVEEMKKLYKIGGIGDVQVKKELVIALNNFLDPIKSRREEAEQMDIRGILENGTNRARELAQETLARVRSNMHLDYTHIGGK